MYVLCTAVFKIYFYIVSYIMYIIIYAHYSYDRVIRYLICSKLPSLEISSDHRCKNKSGNISE